MSENSQIRLYVLRWCIKCLSLTFSIIAEAHLRLAQANCVFPFGDSIELFERRLINALFQRLACEDGDDFQTIGGVKSWILDNT